MWQGGEGQRGPGAEIDGPLCPPLRPGPGALCAGAAETCWVLFPILGAQGKRRGVRGPLIRAGRAGQPECRGIIATCSAISLDCRGRGRPRPPSPAGPAAGSPVSRPVPGRPVPLSPLRRSRGGGGPAAAAVPLPCGSCRAPEPRRGGPDMQSGWAAPAVWGTRGQGGPNAPGALPCRPAHPPGRDAGSPKVFPAEPSRSRRDGRRPGAHCGECPTQRCPPCPPRVLPVCAV